MCILADKKIFKRATPAGRKWVTAALDPYHDYQLELEGFPDLRSAPSVVLVHKNRFTVTAPASAAGGNWDCMVAYTGTDSDSSTAGVVVGDITTGVNYDSTALVAGRDFGSLIIKTEAAGADMTLWTGSGGQDRIDSDQAGSVRGRTIGVGYEVTNTTASMYKQGSVTTAVLPDIASDITSACYVDSTTTLPLMFPQADWGPRYPRYVSELQKIPSSCTWEAADGVYAIPRLAQNVPETTLPYISRRCHWISNGSSTHGASTVGGISEFRVKGALINGWTPMVSMFTGLSPETSLTVTFRTIKEYFPATGDALLPMASPSPSFDPYVLAMYSEMCEVLPYAVPVTMNPAGEYFRKVLKAAALAADMLSPMFGAYAPLVSAGAAATIQLTRKKKVDRQGAGANAMVAKRF